ncbi:uncharacterized protein PGTG_11356 [Puccinia graminis f. sp. tritici CRL 75-36-700-3]|uniref:GDP/GTP exchange factor Sec2 N-terminal domain-containing protein n=1 Tax=Puccinia graminis f. sp. tritici (strain CRL 75-36-700-3 / race SCCL) TaxID=418459 RepID=E3KLL2_PUCGT|nr:uncharacterized protein PGTG_11356 [Puccinia graminis f. sp. tritici CRL 75-36-700-3]EFP85187.1 hypothetical protein PGTG_11356 [Puccinia graminis f. sp. tritici CRL 75-36-700-3]
MTTISTRTIRTTSPSTNNNLQPPGCFNNSTNHHHHLNNHHHHFSSPPSQSSLSPSSSSSSSASSSVTITDPSIHSHPNHIPSTLQHIQPEQDSGDSELTDQLNQLNLKLVRSFERISNLEDELHESREKNKKLVARNTLLELESAQHKEALKGGILVERANVQLELQRLTQRVTLESERRSQSEASLSTINQELDDLSVSLFTEANRLVAAEKIQRMRAERKVMEVEEAMKRVEEVIEARRDQTNHLRLSLEAAESQRDQYKAECETLRNQLNSSHSDSFTGLNINPTSSIDSLKKSSPSGSIVNSRESLGTPLHNNPLSIPHNEQARSPQFSPYSSISGASGFHSTPQLKLSQETIPFTEFLQFVHYLRRTREETLTRSSQPPGLTESYYSAAAAITNIGITATPSSRPVSSMSSSSFSSSKEPAPALGPKGSIAPLLPLTQHLSQPFVKRCLEEDSDPALRLDLAPGLNFMSRRATLNALLEGNLVIEPVWSESGQASGFENCTLCGCSLDPWLSARAPSTGSSNHVASSNSSTAGSTVRKMLRGGAWSFGGIGKPKRASHPVTSTQPAEKSTLVPSVSLKLPSSGRSTPNLDDTASLHIHTLKTADGSSTRYPICPTYCLARLRAVCHFWTFVRSLERGVLLDESFWFAHYINQSPASSRFTETHSLGLAYDHALRRIRGQNRSIDSVDGSSPLTHSVQSSAFTTDNNALQIQSSNPTDLSFEISGEPNPEESKSLTKESIDAQVTIPSEEAHQDSSNPTLKPPPTPDPVHLSQLSPSPSPTSTTEHDMMQELAGSDAHHSDQTDTCGTSLTIRPTVLSNEVPILSPAPSPALRRIIGRSPSQTVSGLPSTLSKGHGTGEGPESSLKTLEVTDSNQLGGGESTAQSAHTTGHGDQRHVDGATPLRNPPRSAPMSSFENSCHLRHQSRQKSQSSLELMEAGWEEKCWQQVVKLKEEIFFKRVGLSLVPN